MNLFQESVDLTKFFSGKIFGSCLFTIYLYDFLFWRSRKGLVRFAFSSADVSLLVIGSSLNRNDRILRRGVREIFRHS